MEESDFGDFLSYLKHYILGFIFAIVLAISGVMIYDTLIKKPIYQAKTTVVVAKSDNTENSAAMLNDVNTSQKLTTTYSEIAKSELVLNRVIENLGLPISVKQLSKNVTVGAVDGTSIISVSVQDLDPEQAAIIANEIAEVFADEVIEIYNLDNVSQLSTAIAPEAPSNDTLSRDMLLAATIAVAVVAGWALVRFHLNDAVKHSDDTEKIFGLPTIGRIPKSDVNCKKKKWTGAELVVYNSPKSIVSENIKRLRTNLQFTAIDKNLKTILVTSTNASEGKSFVTANLAISFAQSDKRVLLVDCDLRKGRLHTLFQASNLAGLSNLLTDKLENMERYVKQTEIKNLNLITCGTYPPNPSELLASKKNKKLIKKLHYQYDVVIFDGAPVNGLADSVILSSLMDETIIVVKDNDTTRADLMAAKDALSKVGAKTAGIVFNMTDQKTSKYHYYYYD